MPTITTDIQRAAQTLLSGNLVAIPTETVYGLAADASQEAAIAKVFALKKRPQNHPLIMHVSPDWDLSQWVEFIPEYAYELMRAFWPGPLTFVFKAKVGAVHPLVTGGQDTVAIRAPAHPIALALLESVARPLVAPSANPFSMISPTTAEHVAQSFEQSDLLIVEGGRCALGIESTIILVTDPYAYKILRPGLIDNARINEVVNASTLESTESIRVSGAMAQHYQPEKPLYYFDDAVALSDFCKDKMDEVFVLSFSKIVKASMAYQLPHDPLAVAYELYYQLRFADASNAQAIVIELPPKEGLWQAIYERILKAGQPWADLKLRLNIGSDLGLDLMQEASI